MIYCTLFKTNGNSMEPTTLNTSKSTIGSFLVNGVFSLTRHGESDICTLSREFFIQLLLTFVMFFALIFVVWAPIAAIVMVTDYYTFQFFTDFYMHTRQQTTASATFWMATVVTGVMLVPSFALVGGFHYIKKKLRNHEDGIVMQFFKSKRNNICFKVDVK